MLLNNGNALQLKFAFSRITMQTAQASFQPSYRDSRKAASSTERGNSIAIGWKMN
jgi:hypothetical protein